MLFPSALFLLICGAVLFCASQSYLAAQDAANAPEKPGRVNTFNDFSKSMSNTFGKSKNRTSNTTLIIFVVSFGSIIVGALVAYDRYTKSRNTKEGYFSTESLFKDLCRTHNFDRTEQTILRKLAKEFQLSNPLDLFVEPRFLERALAERVVPYTQNQIRKIFLELFSPEQFSFDHEEKAPSWFAWTVVKSNLDADQLKNESVPTLESQIYPDQAKVQRWDPSLWEDVDRAVKGFSATMKPSEKEAESTNVPEHIPTYSAAPIKPEVEELETQTYNAIQPEPQAVRQAIYRDFEPPSESPQSRSEPMPPGIDTSQRFYAPEPPSGTTYKPQYPDTNNSAVRPEPDDGFPTKSGASAPRSNSGSQILSTLIDSVNDLNYEMNAKSIRNNLERLTPTSPNTLRKMKPVSLPDNSAKFVSLDEIEVLPSNNGVATAMQTLPMNNVQIKPIEVESETLNNPRMTIAEFMRYQIKNDEDIA